MPELPEIETVKLQLAKVLVGQKLVRLEMRSNRVTKSDLNSLVGKEVLGVRRLGKVLLVDFGPDMALGFHFKMTGQLIYDDGKNRIVGGHPTEDFVNKLPSVHTRVIFDFEKGRLFFNDQRMFGWIEINPKFIESLGPEPFDISSEEFTKRFNKLKKPIKVAIMEQDRLSGVGNIYANDACWEAGIDPRMESGKLKVESLENLLKAIRFVLREGIKYGGATAANYVSLHGVGGHYQDHFRTYAREGMPCLRKDGGTIEKIVLGGRGTFFCSVCQK